MELNDQRIIFRQKNKRTYSQYDVAHVFLFVLMFFCLEQETVVATSFKSMRILFQVIETLVSTH
mgnify:FL=1